MSLKIEIWWLVILSLFSCGQEEMTNRDEGEDLMHIAYEPKIFEIVTPDEYGKMPQPEDNKATVDGVELGRHLFFDPILSVDSTISCASCHFPERVFTDGKKVSEGVNGLTGRRSSMSLVNVGFVNTGLFWDGRAKTLEDQVPHPIQDPVEMASDWQVLLPRLQRSTLYKELFRKAFGISNSLEMNEEHVKKAIAQFERTIVSSGNSKYERVVVKRELVIFSESEENGYEMFSHELNLEIPDAECSHCHTGPLLTTHGFFNNGITKVDSYDDFDDMGLGGTMMPVDSFNIGKFRAPSLLNITLTAPYMHDGRFETLEEVVEHYNSGVHDFVNVDPNLRKLGLTEQDKKDIIAFLHTLVDTSYLESPHLKSPF